MIYNIIGDRLKNIVILYFRNNKQECFVLQDSGLCTPGQRAPSGQGRHGQRPPHGQTTPP